MDVYRNTSQSIIVHKNGNKHNYILNPKSGFVLMPADDYGKYNGQERKEIKNCTGVSKIFNHPDINKIQ